jgi:hypothetical protein
VVVLLQVVHKRLEPGPDALVASVQEHHGLGDVLGHALGGEHAQHLAGGAAVDGRLGLGLADRDLAEGGGVKNVSRGTVLRWSDSWRCLVGSEARSQTAWRMVGNHRCSTNRDKRRFL